MFCLKKKMTALRSLNVSVLLLPLALSAASWGTFCGSNSRTCEAVPGTPFPSMTQKWNATFFSVSPPIADSSGRIIAVSSCYCKNGLVAFDALSGKVLWSSEARFFGSGNAVTQPSLSTDGSVLFVATATGEADAYNVTSNATVIWTDNYLPGYSLGYSIITRDGAFVAPHYDNTLRAFDASGAELWSTGVAAGQVAEDPESGRLFLASPGPLNSAVGVLSALDGSRVVWSQPLSCLGVYVAGPAVSNGLVFVAYSGQVTPVTSSNVYAFRSNASTAAILVWNASVPLVLDMALAISSIAGAIVVAGSTGSAPTLSCSLVALDSMTGELLWTTSQRASFGCGQPPGLVLDGAGYAHWFTSRLWTSVLLANGKVTGTSALPNDAAGLSLLFVSTPVLGLDGSLYVFAKASDQTYAEATLLAFGPNGPVV
jgi:outer membrane protein assembly factor BamB